MLVDTCATHARDTTLQLDKRSKDEHGDVHSELWVVYILQGGREFSLHA